MFEMSFNAALTLFYFFFLFYSLTARKLRLEPPTTNNTSVRHKPVERCAKSCQSFELPAQPSVLALLLHAPAAQSVARREGARSLHYSARRMLTSGTRGRLGRSAGTHSGGFRVIQLAPRSAGEMQCVQESSPVDSVLEQPVGSAQ